MRSDGNSSTSSSVRSHHVVMLYFRVVWGTLLLLVALLSTTTTTTTMVEGLVTPSSSSSSSSRSAITLRDFLLDQSGFHLAMGPSFFGFYAYFGALTALNEDTLLSLSSDGDGVNNENNNRSFLLCNNSSTKYLKSVCGASAGAMAAGFLAAGCDPRAAGDFACSLGLTSFADPPGLGGILRGRRFQNRLQDFLISEISGNGSNNDENFRIEDTIIPVAVSAYDIRSREVRILCKGPLARAMRASATFPFLFQPVSWKMDGDQEHRYFLVDGGVTDSLGLQSLSKSTLLVATSSSDEIESNKKQSGQRILNLNIGAYERRYGEGPPPGPSDVVKNNNDATTTVVVSEMVSMTVENTPKCGPLQMSNGRYAFEAARLAVSRALDLPMTPGKEPGHYELHLDASEFVAPLFDTTPSLSSSE